MLRISPRKRQGFTLIELLVVVVIIGILASIGVKGYAAAMDRARNSGVVSNCRSVMLGIENWKTDHNGLPPELIGANPAAGVASDSQADSANFQVAYVPGNFLPKGPWSKVPQTAEDPQCTCTALLTNVPAVAGSISGVSSGGSTNFAPLNIDGKTGYFNDGLANNAAGSIAPNGPTLRTDYGYMYYAGDSSSGRYMVCGVGKVQSGQISSPTVVGIKTNFQ